METKPTENLGFERELLELVRKHPDDFGTDTPDYVLVNYLMDCLKAYEIATAFRDAKHGIETPLQRKFITIRQPLGVI